MLFNTIIPYMQGLDMFKCYWFKYMKKKHVTDLIWLVRKQLLLWAFGQVFYNFKSILGVEITFCGKQIANQ